MLVKAKCVTPCWDSDNAIMYTPGSGSLPEGLYEIDRDGPLAALKLGSTFVFVFDRTDKKEELRQAVKNMLTTPLNPNKGKPNKGYTCKQCEEIFPHPYALRMHKKTHEVAVEQTA